MSPLTAQTDSVPLPACSPEPKKSLRVAIVCDYVEENWPSMDLVGNMLSEHLRHAPDVAAESIRPTMNFAGQRPGMIIRAIGRFVQYPRVLRKIAPKFDVFHIVDHSYAHLVHELPAQRTVVTCHDLDAFRCLLEPSRERRSFLFRAMARRILGGLQSAAHVACASAATRNAILHHGLVPKERLSVVPNGVHPAFSATADSTADEKLSRILGRKPGVRLELLHVGSTIPRKRIDTLLRVFYAVRKNQTNVRLIRIGSAFTSEQQSLARKLGVMDSIDTVERLDAGLLGACYRRAAILLQPSDAEGFGLPVIEALACGTTVVASDIPPLRETGGDVASFCPVGDIDAWTSTILHLLSIDEPARLEHRSRALEHAARFTWTNYASQMSEIYRQVATA